MNIPRFPSLLPLFVAALLIFAGCSSNSELMAEEDRFDPPVETEDPVGETDVPSPTSARPLIEDPADKAPAVLKDRFPEFFPDDVPHSIPFAEIRHGGPPKDGIPALTDPRVLPALRANYLRDMDVVLGIEINDQARAYPIRIMNWHEIVNDEVGGESIVVTYCPLCGTGIAFDARAAGRVLEFGVSGLLYNSDLLMYDRRTETPSLWAQALGEAVVGPRTGVQLEILPLTQTTWGEWKRTHPGTTVLSTDTGYPRDYGRDPYAGYADSAALFFPVNQQDGRLHPKELVLGVRLNGATKAYRISALQEVQVLNDTLGGRSIVLLTSPDSDAVRVYLTDGREFEGSAEDPVEVQTGDNWKVLEDSLTNPRTGDSFERYGEVFVSFWFGWFTFYPDTLLYP